VLELLVDTKGLPISFYIGRPASSLSLESIQSNTGASRAEAAVKSTVEGDMLSGIRFLAIVYPTGVYNAVSMSRNPSQTRHKMLKRLTSEVRMKDQRHELTRSVDPSSEHVADVVCQRLTAYMNSRSSGRRRLR